MTETLAQPLSATKPSALAVDLGPLKLDKPVMPASGCFGPELGTLIPLELLGAVVTKTVFASVRSGNPAHRLAETPDGMLNAVGIPSPGIRGFIAEVLPRYAATGVPVIVSVGGLSIDDYARAAAELADVDCAAFEVNVSCPNLEEGGLEIGSVPEQVAAVIERVVAETSKPVIAKLTPNVTRISTIARAAEAAGASILTVANTFVGVSIDYRSGQAALGNGSGGFSGPAIKPLTLQKVDEVARAVNLPIIGCGGICTASDLLEYVSAGASAVQVGTATFTRPRVMVDILEELPSLISELGANSYRETVQRFHDRRRQLNASR